MKDNLKNVLVAKLMMQRLRAKIKIKCVSEHPLRTSDPEHPDITAEVDKLVEKMAQVRRNWL